MQWHIILYFITFILVLLLVNKKQVLHKFGEDDIMRQNARVIQIHSHIIVKNSFSKGNSDDKAQQRDVQKYMVSAVKQGKNFWQLSHTWYNFSYYSTYILLSCFT